MIKRRRWISILSLAAFAAASCPMAIPAQAATMKKQTLSCSAQAKKDANNKARGRIFKTAAMGGMSALVIGAIISANNKSGKEKMGGAFGGGVIAGKAYKAQWQRDYSAALSGCRKKR